MSYIVFARKYRPQTFSEIVGQSHITTTLSNAISRDRVSHAYLFAGPRGIGKTTTARILAKALNCEKGPTTSPCNKCASCTEITQGTSLDILEIDGASNRGIEEIRNLRENIKFAPSKGRFKVYIIDEVHMLTQEAFNALLKTLEEPPPHIKFIFATTQPHKVPPTILSRCQRFDFRRISTNDILMNLKMIAKEEKLSVEDKVLILIAKYADGSMRDAEVILDQITSFSKKTVNMEDVVAILGIVDEDILFGLSGSIKDKNATAALQIIDRIVNEGKDVAQVVTSLIGHFRNLAIIKVAKDLSSLIDASPESLKRYEDESGKFSIEDILYIINTLSNTVDFIRKTNLSKIPFETAMVKLTRMGRVISMDEMLEKINMLEGKASGTKICIDPPAASRPRDKDAPRAIPAPEPPAAAKVDDTKIPENPANKAPGPEEADRSADVDMVISSWSRILSHVRSKKTFVALYLQRGYPLTVESGVLTIGFPRGESFHKGALETSEYKAMVEESVREILKNELRVKFTLDDSASGKNNNANSGISGEGALEDPDGQDLSGSRENVVEPIIKDAINIFGGEVRGNGKGASK